MVLEVPYEVNCPYCLASFTMFVDMTQGDSSFIEDCQVCCQPIQFTLSEIDIENESFSLILQPMS